MTQHDQWRGLFLLSVVAVLAFIGGEVQAGSLENAITVSASGMKAQGERMKVVAQNIANAGSTGVTPGAEPYRRKTITFENRYDKASGVEIVQVKDIGRDTRTDFEARYDPAHPAANSQGYVLLPNVKTAIEMTDMREAERSYEANIGAMETSKRMYFDTLHLLR